MRLHWIRLENFLGFKGSNDILFSHAPEKPITLIDAQNASGKTTLSKALYWLLYNEFKWHAEGDPLSDDNIISTEEITASVEVSFEIKNLSYSFKRTISRDGSNQLKAFEVDELGSYVPIKGPDKIVKSIFSRKWAVLHSIDSDQLQNLMKSTYKKIIADLISEPNKDKKIRMLELEINRIWPRFGAFLSGPNRVRLNENTFDILEGDMVYRPGFGTVCITGLAFHIAMISLRKQFQIETDLPITDAPIFLDDCFGNVDAMTCDLALQYLAQIPNQVIVLSNKSRLSGVDKIGTFIGAELTFNRTADSISIKNMQIT